MISYPIAHTSVNAYDAACIVSYGDYFEAVWCHVQVQAPLEAPSPLLITLTGTNVKTPHCIASVLLLITTVGVDIGVYTGSHSVRHTFTHTLEQERVSQGYRSGNLTL